MTKNFKFLVGTVAAFALTLVVSTTASAAYTHSVTLKMGSTGSQVMALQQTLNLTACKVATSGAGSAGMETMTFAGKTKAAVQCFQLANGLTADGVVGPMTGAKLASIVVTSTPGTTPTTTGTGLSGGAADIDLSQTTTSVESTVKEDDSDVAVLGFEVEADGGDVAVTSVRVVFNNHADDATSQRLTDYFDEVSVWLDGKNLGSADAEDFSREREDTGADTYTETIQLSNAVVREGDKEKFYVAVSTASNIDDEDQAADWDVELESVRFTDSTGAILTSDASSIDETFGFEDASADDDLSVKSSSANPDDMTVKVDENDNSDEVLALAFKLDVDEDSSDVTIFDLPIDITVNDSGTMASNVEDIIDSVIVKVGSDEFEADVTGDGEIDTPGSEQTFAYAIDLDEGDLVIDAGDTVEVKVYITFKEQDDNYGVGTTVVASLDASDIEAEGEDDDITGITGDRTGGTLTLNTSAATLSNVDWQVGSAGTFIDFIFTVEAEDEDVDVLTSSIDYTQSGTASVDAPVLTKISGDADSISGGFSVAEGDSAKFRARFAVSDITDANGTYVNVTVESVAGQQIDEDDQVSPTATVNVN